jgi:protein-S-isoprenylcysteine O-methyltransferase Ste14
MTGMKKKDYVPLVMWLMLLMGILILASVRPGRINSVWSNSPVDLDFVFICLYILWMAVELRVTQKDVRSGEKKTSDHATCQLYGFGQAATFLTALWFQPLWQRSNSVHFVGISLFLLGVCCRLRAIRALGRFYSHRVRTVSDHRIVSSGPYRFTRHPAYGGMITANAGVCLFFFNWVTFFVFLIILVPAILFRIIIEEKMLFTIEGYAEFAKNRKRLFPGIW